MKRKTQIWKNKHSTTKFHFVQNNSENYSRKGVCPRWSPSRILCYIELPATSQFGFPPKQKNNKKVLASALKGHLNA